jgi:hypothetical protein
MSGPFTRLFTSSFRRPTYDIIILGSASFGGISGLGLATYISLDEKKNFLETTATVAFGGIFGTFTGLIGGALFPLTITSVAVASGHEIYKRM